MKKCSQLPLFEQGTREQEIKVERVLPPQPQPGKPVFQSQEERLEELGLRYGAAYVYRIGGRLYAWGDFRHCPKEDIEHNIRRLTQMLLQEPGLAYIGKSYQADIYRHKGQPEWSRIFREVIENYREKVWEVDQEGGIVREAVISPQVGGGISG